MQVFIYMSDIVNSIYMRADIYFFDMTIKISRICNGIVYRYRKYLTYVSDSIFVVYFF